MFYICFIFFVHLSAPDELSPLFLLKLEIHLQNSTSPSTLTVFMLQTAQVQLQDRKRFFY
ncbi:MAG: hypothetical protein D3910_03980 [Candidatus Electrothrix sp. ATG2]|nr:hypothetical protein [Candidatus Electrothrix sp. ATG2]